MEPKAALLIYMSIYVLFNVHQICFCQICMKWTVDRQLLTLTCKVRQLVFSVSFHDPSDKEVAYCYSPVPSSNCLSHYGNGSVYQQLSKNETIFVVRGKINNKMNGNWSCLHGASKDRTSIRVQLIGDTEKISSSSVNISGPKYIRKNEEMDLLCSSNTLPAGLSANFIVNEYPYTKIIKIGDNCYSSPNISLCTEGKCNCTNEGRSYTWKYHNFYHDKTITIMCNMEFASVGQIGDCLFVDTLDEKTDDITTTPFPLIVSTWNDYIRQWSTTEDHDERNTKGMYFGITHTENDTTRHNRREKQFLDAEMFIWISAGATGFVALTVLAVFLARRFFYCGLTSRQNRIQMEIYNESQPTENQQIYDITSPHYEEIGDIHTNEEAGGNDTYEEMDKDNVEEEQYETPHHYLELV